MTLLYLTVDTEYSPGLFRKLGKDAREENFASSVACDTRNGSAGIFYQMDVLDSHGLKGVFFVDPMPALVWGIEAIADIAGPIASRGHDVQLHLHTEWLEFAGAANPLPGRTGRDIKDFALEEQCELIDCARTMLVAAGAPPPIAFRAGNYGANDDTLRALASLGMRYDSSHCPGILHSDCDISLGPGDRDPVRHCSAIEVPIGCIRGPGENLRHFQLTALTATEVIAALRHAARHVQDSMTLVSHSFELLSRDRKRVNPIVRRRFESLCDALEHMSDVSTATYSSNPPEPRNDHRASTPLSHKPLRTLHRYAEQALSNVLYGSR